MKMRSLLILLALFGGLALWSNWPAAVIAQQAVDDHAGHDHGAAKADEHEGHDHADHAKADGTDAAGHADDHDDHAGHDHGGEADEHDDEGHAGHEGADGHAEHGDAEDGHDDHAGRGHEEEEGGTRIAPEVMREFGIEVRSADGGHIEKIVRLPGEVVFNADRIAHVTPTVAGIVRKVNFSVGDQVKAGQVMAVLNSRELAAARSEFLAAKARLALAEANLNRDQRLFREKVGTERAVLESQQAFEETRIALNQAENALHALGYSHDQIAKIETLDDTEFNTYELTSPLGGMVTARHVTVGEVIEPGNGSPFVVADLSTVWVNLTVYQRDLAHVQAGQHVTIRFGHGIPDAEGKIAFISPSLDETTRTATARIVLKNPEGHWRPGLFVEGRIETGRASASVVVPRNAITEMDGEQIVFVQTDEGFEPREVTVGRTTSESAEIVTGLKPGERYIAANVLAFKAEMNRAALERAGHAH